jgi:triacylglycerol lipase
MAPDNHSGGSPPPPTLSPDEASLAPTWRAAYSDRTAVLMSKFAQYAYLPFGAATTTINGVRFRPTAPDGLAQLKQLLGGGGFRLIDAPFSCNDSQGFVAINDQELAVLAFRGTANWGDWQIDMNAGLMPMPGFEQVQVHRGFWNAFESTLEPMMNALAQAPSDLGLYITGHSFGGALAQIAAAALSSNDNVAACYTFGSPRVATLRFDTDVKCPHYRVIDNWDFVPGVPPANYWGYLHTGDPRLLRDDMPREAFRRDRDLIPRFTVDLWSLLIWPFTGQISSANDHMIWNYRKKLDSIRDARAPR